MLSVLWIKFFLFDKNVLWLQWYIGFEMKLKLINMLYLWHWFSWKLFLFPIYDYCPRQGLCEMTCENCGYGFHPLYLFTILVIDPLMRFMHWLMLTMRGCNPLAVVRGSHELDFRGGGGVEDPFPCSHQMARVKPWFEWYTERPQSPYVTSVLTSKLWIFWRLST